MPGFYRETEFGMHWTTFARMPGEGILEMSIQDADVFFEKTLPYIKQQLFNEGVTKPDIKFSMCKPLSGAGYGQVSAEGSSNQSNDGKPDA